MSVTALIRDLMAKGFTMEQALMAAESMEATSMPQRTARQERNRRYYEAHRDELASKRRLKASETSNSDGSVLKASEPRARVEDIPTTSKITRQTDKSLRDQQFDEFWSVYPRKVGKADARRKFDAALKLASFDTIMAGARRYAAERAGQDPSFTKHPATWLHGACWDDEPAPARQPPRSASPPQSVPRNPGERAFLLLTNGNPPHEPPSPDTRRLESRNGRRQAEGPGAPQGFAGPEASGDARRFTIPANPFGVIAGR